MTDPLDGLPDDLVRVLRDPSIVIPQDAHVFELIAAPYLEELAKADPCTAEMRLCDDDGIVRRGAMHHGTDYPCTGHAHFAGAHIRCTTPIHFDARERWHTQTLLGGGNVPPEKRGDCVRACITSILGLPIDAIENVHGGEWWDRLNAEVGRFGYALAILDAKMEPPRCYWIATLPSLNLPPEPDGSEALHCVIARGYDLVHDPGVVKPGYTPEKWVEAWNAGRVVEAWALVPLDPAREPNSQSVPRP